jgi:hypothetical protein
MELSTTGSPPAGPSFALGLPHRPPKDRLYKARGFARLYELFDVPETHDEANRRVSYEARHKGDLHEQKPQNMMKT